MFRVVQSEMRIQKKNDRHMIQDQEQKQLSKNMKSGMMIVVKNREIMEIDTMRQDLEEAKARDRVVVAADPVIEKIHIDTMRQDLEETKVRDPVVVAADPERENMKIFMMRQDPEEAKVRDSVVVAADPEREK